MENENEGGLPAPDAQAATGTENESMTVSEFAASLVKKAPAKAVADEPKEAAEETESAAESEAQAEEPVTAEGETEQDNEQPDTEPETEDDKDVLSQLTPKTLEKFQKRTDQLTARAKTAEEKLAAAEAKVKEMEAKAAEPKPAPEPEIIAITPSDPGDLTGTAKSEADLDKLARDAQSVLTTYENHEDAITRAIARDEPTVTIDGTEVQVAQLRSMKKLAEKHITTLIPAKRKFMAERAQMVTVAKTEFPALFDSRTQEYQELQAIKRQYPVLNTLPGLENWIGFALEGMKARKAKQDAAATAKPAVKPASATPPKAAADSTDTTAQAKSRAQPSGGEKAKLKAELVKAEKEFESSNSKTAYEKVLKIQSRLKLLQ